MKITAGRVDGQTALKPPKKGMTILDDVEINRKNLVNVNIYLRNARDCPWARGNWLIDLEFKDGSIYCVRLPKEMLEKDVLEYVKPLLKDQS